MTGQGSDGLIQVYLYNSTWNASNSVSKPVDTAGLGVFLGTIDALLVGGWMNLTGLDYYLNTSQTDNNTYL